MLSAADVLCHKTSQCNAPLNCLALHIVLTMSQMISAGALYKVMQAFMQARCNSAVQWPLNVTPPFNRTVQLCQGSYSIQSTHSPFKPVLLDRRAIAALHVKKPLAPAPVTWYTIMHRHSGTLATDSGTVDAPFQQLRHSLCATRDMPYTAHMQPQTQT